MEREIPQPQQVNILMVSVETLSAGCCQQDHSRESRDVNSCCVTSLDQMKRVGQDRPGSPEEVPRTLAQRPRHRSRYDQVRPSAFSQNAVAERASRQIIIYESLKIVVIAMVTASKGRCIAKRHSIRLGRPTQNWVDSSVSSRATSQAPMLRRGASSPAYRHDVFVPSIR